MNAGSSFDEAGNSARASSRPGAPGATATPPPSDTIVIVSSFKPFQGGRTNPSQAAARQYAESVSRRHGCGIVEVTLEVVWDLDQGAIRSEIERINGQRSRGVIEWAAFGQGRGNTMETVARNQRAPIQDNLGKIPGGGPGHPGMLNDPQGPEHFRSDPADVQRILSGLGASGVGAIRSSHAGAFLCESVLYTLLQQQQRGNIRFGRFFHVPTTETMPDGDPEKQRIEEERHQFIEVLAGLTPVPVPGY
jgi:pyrrolidone-carboxylate peptidase